MRFLRAAESTKMSRMPFLAVMPTTTRVDRSLFHDLREGRLRDDAISFHSTRGEFLALAVGSTNRVVVFSDPFHRFEEFAKVGSIERGVGLIDEMEAALLVYGE